MNELSPPVTETAIPRIAGNNAPDLGGPDYWNAMLNESDAAHFLGVGTRLMQKWRYEGGGPQYVFLSSRCLRYRRYDLWQFQQERLKRSTSEYAA